MQAELGVDPSVDAALNILTMPAAELAKQPADVLERSGIKAHHVRRVVAAHTLADRMRRDAEELSRRVRVSQALVDRLNQYASKLPEAML